MNPRWLAGALAVGSLTLALPLGAQPNTPKMGPPQSGPTAGAQPAAQSVPVCSAAHSAIDTAARDVAAGLGRVPDGTQVASAALLSDTDAPRAGALTAKLAELVAGRLGAGVRFDPKPGTLDEARSKVGNGPGLVWLQAKIADGRLHLSADAYPMARTIWARARGQRPGPIAHAFAQARIDAEVRSFLRPIPFVEPHVSKFDGADPNIVALACGDLDGDGGSDLVTMTRQRVLQVRLVGGKVLRVREAHWTDLSVVAPVPLRQPIGFATIVEAARSAEPSGGYLDISISDRAMSARLDPDFTLIEKMKGYAVPSGRSSACTRVIDMQLGKTRRRCVERDASPDMVDVGHRSDAFASDFLVTRDGAGGPIAALRRARGLVVRNSEGDMVIGRVGAQLAIGDIDQDGAADLVTTLDVLSRKHDLVEWRSLLPTGTVKRRFKLPVKTGVDAVAICPPDGPGRAPIVVATKKQLWVLR